MIQTMKHLSKFNLLAPCASVAAFSLLSAQAGPDGSTLDPKNVLIDEASKSVVVEDCGGWFFSAGATVRSIDAGFKLNGHKDVTLDWNRYFKKNSGRGDVGLFKGGLGKKQYNDGSVGPDYSALYTDDGTAYTSINSASQYQNTGRIAYGTDPIYAATFHSDGYRYGSDSSSRTVNIEDSQVGVGPQLQFGRQICIQEGIVLNVLTGWSYVNTDHSSGNQRLAEIAVREAHTVYSYTYDTDYGPVGPGNNIESFPFRDLPGDPNSDYSLLIYDANGVYARDSGFLDPRKGSKTTHRTAASFYAIGSSDLDVNLNEIPFGFELGWQPVKGLTLGITGGATLNVIDYDLTSQVSWYRAGRSNPILSQRWTDSGSPVKVGLYGGIMAKYALTEKVYLEAHGSYRWVDSVHASAGVADVEIDVSSFEGGLGIGYIF